MQSKPTVGERLDASFQTRIKENRAEDGKQNRYTFTISTGSVDRHGTRVDPQGGDFAAFMQNPVVLFNHNYDRIIGRALSVQVRGDKVVAQMEFDTENEFAREKMGQVDRNYLKATSIGFIVKEWTFNEEDDVYEIKQWELVEFSIVTVPSNRESLIEARSAGAVAGIQQELKEIKEELAKTRSQLNILGASDFGEVREDAPKDAEAAQDAPEATPNDQAASEAEDAEERAESATEAPEAAADQVTEADDAEEAPPITEKQIKKGYTFAQIDAMVRDQIARKLGKK